MDFAQVESKYKELKREYDAGAITEEEFKAQLEELMIEDEEGRWWIIGYETGTWHYHDGEKWVQSEPPAIAARREQVEALCQEGAAALAAQDWSAANEKFEAALALEPGHPEATKGLAEAKARAEEVAKPEVPMKPEAPPAAPKVRWGWIVAGVIGLIVLVILISQMFPSGPEVAFWVDREVIAPGECTILHWEAPGLDFVRLYGPGLDPDMPMPSGEAIEVCLEETATYELKSPDWEVIATLEVHVGE